MINCLHSPLYWFNEKKYSLCAFLFCKSYELYSYVRDWRGISQLSFIFILKHYSIIVEPLALFQLDVKRITLKIKRIEISQLYNVILSISSWFGWIVICLTKLQFLNLNWDSFKVNFTDRKCATVEQIPLRSYGRRNALCDCLNE